MKWNIYPCRSSIQRIKSNNKLGNFKHLNIGSACLPILIQSLSSVRQHISVKKNFHALETEWISWKYRLLSALFGVLFHTFEFDLNFFCFDCLRIRWGFWVYVLLFLASFIIGFTHSVQICNVRSFADKNYKK